MKIRISKDVVLSAFRNEPDLTLGEFLDSIDDESVMKILRNLRIGEICNLGDPSVDLDNEHKDDYQPTVRKIVHAMQDRKTGALFDKAPIDVVNAIAGDSFMTKAIARATVARMIENGDLEHVTGVKRGAKYRLSDKGAALAAYGLQS